MAVVADGTTVVMGADGEAVVVKRGDPARVAHEATMLRHAAHPGVVELASPPDGDGSNDVVATRFVGGGTMAERLAHPLDVRQAIEVATSLATTLADLHERGIAHRRMSADHVLVNGERAVVCGLAEAVLVTDADDPALDDDVAAVAGLVDELAATSTGAQADWLRQVARRAMASAPEGRPPMRGLARMLVASNPDGPPAALYPDAGSRRLTPRVARPAAAHRSRAPAVVVALAVAALGAAAVGVALGAGGTGGARNSAVVAPAPPTSSLPGPTSTSPPTTTSASRSAPRRLWPASTCPTVGTPLIADLDGDGCDEEIRIDDGVVASGERRWHVAGADDVVTLGDWDCDGTVTPAVLRPASGQLWVFDRWASADEELSATLAGVVADAVSARSVEPLAGGTSCDRIEVVHPDDTSTIVTPP